MVIYLLKESVIIQPVSHAVQQVDRFVRWVVGWSFGQSDQSVSQSAIPTAGQLVNQSAIRPASQSVGRSTGQSVSQSASWTVIS